VRPIALVEAQPMAEEKTVSWITSSPEETERLGELLARLLDKGDVLALSGDLGGGKTTMTRGIARGMDVPDRYVIQSPTFTVINEYPGRVPLFHLDLYRIEVLHDGVELGLEEYLEPEGVSVIEWAEKLGPELPSGALVVVLGYLGEHTRRIVARAKSERARHLLKALTESYPPESS